MILGELIANYPTVGIVGNLDIDITGISHDSRNISKDNIFVAKKGYNYDGHKYINEAIENGANSIIIEDECVLDPRVTFIKVKDTTDALGFICSNFFNNPWEKLFMIGITGTNGKTSTTYFIKGILDANNIKVGVIGTTGIIIDDELIKLDNTTPDPLVLQYNLNKMVNSNTKSCVMEVSSHALDLKRVDYMDFDIGIFTNLTKDHLDFHMNMQNYFRSKMKLFYKTTKYNIINIDDNYGRDIIKEIGSRINLLTYGIDNIADVYATNIKYSIDKVNFTLNHKKQNIDIKLNIPGRFSVYNALAAASCGIAMNINIDIIKFGLENVVGVKGRFEIVPINKEFTVIIDFAHTADGLEKVLSVIDQFAEGRKIVVFGAGGNRDKTKRPDMGETVGNHADIAIVTSDNPRFEEPSKIIDDIIVGIKKTDILYKIIVDRKEAIEYALSIAEPKDLILLAGKGHEKFTIIGDNLYPFDERQITLNYFKNI